MEVTVEEGGGAEWGGFGIGMVNWQLSETKSFVMMTSKDGAGLKW